MKRLVIGMTAHVDAGKTTLSEAMLYRSGEIRKLGRVDFGSTFLDTYSVEKNRGITVFSKQAVMRFNDNEYTLLDTPGHIDFSAETERAFSVFDYAILVISGIDGVQSHTETIWNMLKKYHIPVFIFVNKMDISCLGKDMLINDMKKRLGSGIIDFSSDCPNEILYERLALCSEKIMNTFLETGAVSENIIAEEMSCGNIYPCCFGSALKLDGIDNLLDIIEKYTISPHYSEQFGARVYKITTENNVRLTHMKITGGSLKVKSIMNCVKGDEISEEKVNQIRIYSGAKYTAVTEATAGTICAVTGPEKTFSGEGIGIECNCPSPLLKPVLSYKVIIPSEIDAHTMLGYMKILEEEDPQLHIIWNERLCELHVQLMGEIQLEILKTMMSERFNCDVQFGEGSIAYKETIENSVEGIGHYEPLRHYAEVHILMEPAEVGSGLSFATDCSEDELSKNWQRLILTHLEEKMHIGVLTGSPITDMKITLVAGRAHIKHTEGGDFRQATYRAVRMGLKSAKSVLLEPFYNFRLEIPSDCVGRALNDLQRMKAEFGSPEIFDDMSVVSGTASVAEMRSYHIAVAGYSRGKGHLSCTLCGYFPCQNAEEVIAEIGYDSDSDVENPSDSIFCSHGSGYVVKWNDVPNFMHTDSGIRFENIKAEKAEPTLNYKYTSSSSTTAGDDELMEIFERTYGKIKSRAYDAMHTKKEPIQTAEYKPSLRITGENYLLVDGYNIIFAWDELNLLARDNLDLARNKLINILCNYQGYKQCKLILVFDAYKIKGNKRETEQVNNITVIYTKEAETADMYIEKVTHELGKNNRVRVATSDRLEQIIILGNDAYRVSANEFYQEVKAVEKEIRDIIEK